MRASELREEIMAIYDLPEWLRERWRAGWETGPVSEFVSGERAATWAKAATWKFSSYYKYRFTFTGTLDGSEWKATASTGGHSEDICRFAVEDPMTWDEICGAGEPGLTITDANGTVLYQSQ